MKKWLSMQYLSITKQSMESLDLVIVSQNL